jgi:hypothetical protein
MSGGPPPSMQGLVRGEQKYASFAQTTEQEWEDLARRAEEARGDRKKQSRCYNMMQVLERRERGELELLFDVREDPAETRNLASENPGKLDELRALMADWYREHHPESITRADVDEAEEKDIHRRLGQLGYLD